MTMPATRDHAWPADVVLFSSCLWCREVIAQPAPDAPWISGNDRHSCAVLGIGHEPFLITHGGCEILHAGSGEAWSCAR
jgi:hypothetical protein